jgi:hypothetical protein
MQIPLRGREMTSNVKHKPSLVQNGHLVAFIITHFYLKMKRGKNESWWKLPVISLPFPDEHFTLSII